MSVDQKLKDAVFRALTAAGLHLVDQHGRANKPLVHAILGIIGSDVMMDGEIRLWLSAKFRDLAGDIDDGLIPGMRAKHGYTFCWVLPVEVTYDDRLIDDKDAIEAVQEIRRLPQPSPAHVLVRRWVNRLS